MSIVSTEDFKQGEYNVPQDNFSDLQVYIDKYEKHYLLQLLGADLYDLFIADLTPTTPQVPASEARFISIFTAFHLDEPGCIYISEGMRVMLQQFIYFHYMADLNAAKPQTGPQKNTSSNGQPVGYGAFNLVPAYNQAVTNYHSIQWFISDNDTDYPEENMQPLEFTSGI